GLLHDTGKVVLGKAFKEDYARLVGEMGKDGPLLVDGETARFGVNHAEIGARLLTRWNFSEEVVDSVKFHHHPSAAGRWERSAACVGLASAIAHHQDEDRKGPARSRVDLEIPLKVLGLADEDLYRYSDRLKENIAL